MAGEESGEELHAELNTRLKATIAAYAEEHGLTTEDVTRSVRELLREKQSPETSG